MRKDQSLRKTKDFAAVRREGRSWPDRLLVLAARRNGLEVSRFGFTVGKRVGNAVVRNKVKRRLREAARLAEICVGWDVVVIARKEASSTDFHTLRRSMMGLLKSADLLDLSPQRLGPGSEVKR